MANCLEPLDKENDLFFYVSVLDSIPLSDSATLDSLEATLSFLMDEIHNQGAEPAKEGAKQKPKRFAASLSTKQVESVSTKFVPKKNCRLNKMGNSHLR